MRIWPKPCGWPNKGLYSTSPNPRVGCVLVRDGRVVGEGWHERAGAPHAEINALAAAGDAARGATAYVTLEPCSHHGRTPPCTEALIKAGIARLVAAMEDPNPLVSGGGCAKLQAAGIEVQTGLMAKRSPDPQYRVHCPHVARAPVGESENCGESRRQDRTQ